MFDSQQQCREDMYQLSPTQWPDMPPGVQHGVNDVYNSANPVVYRRLLQGHPQHPVPQMPLMQVPVHTQHRDPRGSNSFRLSSLNSTMLDNMRELMHSPTPPPGARPVTPLESSLHTPPAPVLQQRRSGSVEQPPQADTPDSASVRSTEAVTAEIIGSSVNVTNT